LYNYFLLLFPVVDINWWNKLDEGSLWAIYNQLSWYYTPLIIEPKLPYPLNSLQDIKSTVPALPNSRNRPLIDTYASAYLPFIPMAGLEPVVAQYNKGSLYTVGYNNYGQPMKLGVAEGVGVRWPKLQDSDGVQMIGRPLMALSWIQPYGRARQGFPSYSYVEVVEFAFEGGMWQRGKAITTNNICNTPYNDPSTDEIKNLSSYDESKGYEALQNAKYNASGTQSIPGSAYKGVKEHYILSEGNPGIFDTIANSNINTLKVCLNGSLGVVSIPSLDSQYTENNQLSNQMNNVIYYLDSNQKPFDVTNMAGQIAHIYTRNKNGYFKEINDSNKFAYCPGVGDNNDASCNKSEGPHDLFYPIMGYGKFSNMGRTGVFFNYLHALLTVHDRTGFGKQLRWPFEAILIKRPGGGCATPNWKCIGGQLTTLMNGRDNREYLTGYITVPRKGFGFDKYIKALYNGGAGRIDFSQKGPIFTTKVPQVCYATKGDPSEWFNFGGKKYCQKVWGKDYGCGQLRWQKGEWDEITQSMLQCENPWMNPMDDGGRLEYIGKNFVQFYAPPELAIKNPYYQQSIPTPTLTKAQISEMFGTNNPVLPATVGDINTYTTNEFFCRWLISFYIYNDSGIHKNDSWPFGMYGTLGLDDNCIYAICLAMGWKSITISSKDCVGGQQDICEYPYIDSEILFCTPLMCCSG